MRIDSKSGGSTKSKVRAEYETMPLISVVVSTFNQGQLLAEALESVFRQDYPCLEVVVLDRGSSADSAAIIRSYASRLTHCESLPDAEQAAALNAGMSHCTGDLVAWLNASDFYWEDAFWIVARAFAEYPGRGLYIGNGLLHDEKTKSLLPFCPHHVVISRDALKRGMNYVLQPATFFLRAAWERMGGLKAELRYCMDWDVILRIAEAYPAVLINEMLAVRRKRDKARTCSEELERVIELSRFHGTPATPGLLFHALEALLSLTGAAEVPAIRPHILCAIEDIRQRFAAEWGNRSGFPEHGDPQDSVYIPKATSATRGTRASHAASLPTISVITPSLNQEQYLAQALESILSQEYPRLETLVFDGGSTDGSLDVLRAYGERLSHWTSEPDRGPAHAINKGLSRARGEILGWLNSDDMLTPDALWRVGRAFAEDPELDMVFANALYIDEGRRLFHADHGIHRTGLYYGKMEHPDRVPYYWLYVHAVPQPTVFFRRRLVDQGGMLDESYQYIFDFELFWRFARSARIQKIERTLALYRIHSCSKTSDWSRFLVELYRFSRPKWPAFGTRAFGKILRSYVSTYMLQRHGSSTGRAWYWAIAGVVAVMAVTGLGNPEAMRLRLPRWARRLISRMTISPENSPGAR